MTSCARFMKSECQAFVETQECAKECVLGTVGALAILNQRGDVISAGFKMLWLWKGV